MSIVSKVKDDVTRALEDLVKSKSAEITADILANTPDPALQEEAERLRRPPKPEPSPEAKAERACFWGITSMT